MNILNNATLEQIQVYDVSGNKVLIKNGEGSNSYQLDITNLKSGMYFLNVIDSNGISQKRSLIKQ